MTDVSTTCAVVIFRIKVSCITSVEDIISTDYYQRLSKVRRPIQDYVHPDDQTQPTFEMTPGFKPFFSFKLYLVVLVSLVLRRRRGKTGLPYAARRKSSKNYLHSTPIAPKLRLSIDTVNNGPFEDHVHPDDHAQTTHEMTPGFKPYTVLITYQIIILCLCWNRN